MNPQKFPRLFCSVLLALAAAQGGAVMADEIRMGGTGNALGTAKLLGAAFEKKFPGTKVIVLNSLGSSGALLAVPKGVLDIGLSARPPTPEETGHRIQAIEYARTPTVFAVSNKTQASAITQQQLVALYTGTLDRWPDGVPIRPVLRQPGDDNTRQAKALSAALDAAMQASEKRQGLPYAVTDQEAADKMESTPGAIGLTALSLILSEGVPCTP